MLQEFKKFALKGNVIDLAVGVIIGSAFGKIVASLVNDIIMPLLGIVIGKVDLTGLKWVIIKENITEDIAELSVKYGQFLQTLIDFFIVAFSIFVVIKILSSFKKKEKEKIQEVLSSKEELLLTEIRDILKNKGNTLH